MYVAKYIELHINACDGEPTQTVIANFTVSAATPTRARSWGLLKSGYQ